MPPSNFTEVQAVTIKRPALGMAWRWRTELGLLSGGTAGFLECWHCMGLDLTGLAVGGSAVLAAALPWTRRFIGGRFWCLVTRHRLQSVFWELRLHTRKFRLPLVLWIRPTPVGERAWILLRAGMAPEDFRKATDEIATACAAREARVAFSRRFKLLVTIDVIRRDLLAPGRVVASRLADVQVPDPVPGWLTLPADPDPEPAPVPGPVPPRRLGDLMPRSRLVKVYHLEPLPDEAPVEGVPVPPPAGWPNVPSKAS
jgi:hypothetical protein